MCRNESFMKVLRIFFCENVLKNIKCYLYLKTQAYLKLTFCFSHVLLYAFCREFLMLVYFFYMYISLNVTVHGVVVVSFIVSLIVEVVMTD